MTSDTDCFGNLQRVRNSDEAVRSKLGDDASNPPFIFAVPRVGYRMEKGETQEQEGS